jgi:acyl-CoA dehydrogenase
MEELARGGWSGIGFGLHSEIVAPYILHYGTEEQKKNTCPSWRAGRWWAPSP